GAQAGRVRATRKASAARRDRKECGEGGAPRGPGLDGASPRSDPRGRDGKVMYTDCAQGHSTVRVSGTNEDEFVKNVQDHLRKVHSGMPLPARSDIVKMAKQG